VLTARGELEAVLPGRVRHTARRAELPAVGDWVALRLEERESKGVILAVLPRYSKFSRKVAGDTTHEQVVAANVDIAFLATALDNDFSPRRVERYLVLAWEGGATPVVLLTKADLSDDVDARVAEIAAVAPGVPLHPISVVSGMGLDALDTYLLPGRTVAVLGSSGVGKSTLINRLLGRETLRTAEVRASDQKGRHTTTNRQLLVLPGGALMIDTPGMRELQLWGSNEGVRETFEDIGAIAEDCRFTDCSHDTEPSCAVRRAVEEGTLPAERLENYRKLQAELQYLRVKQDVQARLAQKRQWRTIHKAARNHKPRE
jgi:ribosome biogenesis GTPase